MIYLDSCLVIYAVEPNGAATEAVIRAVERQESNFAASPLVQMECLVGPMRSDNNVLQQAYQRFFSGVTIVAISSDAYRLAALLRARFGLKTPDAIHLAAAQTSGCSALWTNDQRLAAAAGSFAQMVI